MGCRKICRICSIPCYISSLIQAAAIRNRISASPKESCFYCMMLESKVFLTPMIPDCFALRAPTILKTFIIRSFFCEKWLLIHVLAGLKFKNPLASKLASDF